ncbi:MspA family porin [Nocardia sp. NEAU-G5]|uniref:MspA family porin n=1 Tax=Nocardia albiluteola TaxID=2842303 RepID=A0ABS6BBG0_9NOCA|nr:MspA family porin [Nocardia albiluteola]MBU3067627.1 MspA family porin [Nocardia albiluteola]
MRGALGSAIVAGACVPLLLVAGTADADTRVPLPDGHAGYTTHDGVQVHVDRTGESATISGSMAASPLSRNAWVSAVSTVNAKAPANIKVTGGHIETGYLVGCQIDLGSGVHANASGDSSGQNNNSQNGNGDGGGDQGGGNDAAGNGNGGGGGGGGGGNGNGGGGGGGGGGGLTVGTGYSGVTFNGSTPTPYMDPSMSITLKPGQVATKQIQVYNFTGTSGTNQFVDHTISIDGCAGYAEARSYTTIVIQDNVMDSTQTLWGKPFSLG